MDHLFRSAEVRLLLAVIFIWLQVMSAVHAYEHEDKEQHSSHQCTICLVNVSSDDLADIVEQDLSSCKTYSYLHVATSNAIVHAYTVFHQSRAPPEYK